MAGMQPRRKHVPQRTCIVCREKTDKRRLTRLVLTTDAGLVVDPTGKRNGRGAYLCDKLDCWDKAIRTGLLDRAFKATVSAAEKEALAAYRPAPLASATPAPGSRN
jgi:predicted RNA-binding protein YlxR (DUF448 family)